MSSGADNASQGHMTTISAEPQLQEARDAGRSENPVMFLDVAINGQLVGRIKIELFVHLVPRTCENFARLCTGEFRRFGGVPLGYKHTPFHLVQRRVLIQGGDIVNGDGSGSVSVYGDTFPDEAFAVSHGGAGLVSMANRGPNSNGCQFFITCGGCEWMDGKNVVFGRVVEGMHVVRLIEDVPAPQGKPKLPVTIVECGQMY